MLIRCTHNLKSDLKDESVKRYYSDESLTIGEIYIVYAMVVYESNVWYFIDDGTRSRTPIWTPTALFEVIDGRLSRYWVFSSIKNQSESRIQATWAYPEWAYEISYFDNLFEYERREVEIYQRYKNLMDVEFPDPTNLNSAEVGDDLWLLCPFCIDAWESYTDSDGMVVCPKCETFMHNPRYTKGCAPGMHRYFNDRMHIINDATFID